MFAIATTDKSWVDTLKEFDLNSYVNFWTPTPWNIKSLKNGDRFYFMLKAPIRLIGGFGEFVEYKNMNVEDAWVEYGYRNGRKTKESFISSIQTYINKNSKKFGGTDIDPDKYLIGCIILKNCQFWDSDEFINLSSYGISFPNQVVTWKSFSTNDPIHQKPKIPFQLVGGKRIVCPIISNSREGQSKFKSELLKAYNNKCCISENDIPELLEAAHIQEYKNIESNHVQNGLLMRVDIHRLYDNKLIAVDDEYIIHVSNLILDKEYRSFHGRKISLPKDPDNYPCKDALRLYREEFRSLN